MQQHHAQADEQRADRGAAHGQSPQKRVLVLGASGFIGGHVVAALAASGWAVPIAASRRGAAAAAPAVQTRRLDARDPAAMAQALAGVDAVVNCVTGDADSIVGGARVLFSCAARLKPQPRIVHLSTMMVYGSATGTVDESAALLGDWDAYSAAKTEAEHLAKSCTDVVVLRPGIVYGPDSPIWSRGIGLWLQAGRLGDLGAAGAGYCNLVHVDDVVEAVLRSLRAPDIAGEAFNLSLSAPPTWNEYFQEYSRALGCTAVTISAPRLWTELNVLAPPLKVAQILAHKLRLNWQPPAPIRPWLPRICRHPIRLDVGKAERQLGMRWRPLDAGLRQCAAALRGAVADAPSAHTN